MTNQETQVIIDKKMYNGKYRGQLFANIPTSYLAWMVTDWENPMPSQYNGALFELTRRLSNLKFKANETENDTEELYDPI